MRKTVLPIIAALVTASCAGEKSPPEISKGNVAVDNQSGKLATNPTYKISALTNRYYNDFKYINYSVYPNSPLSKKDMVTINNEQVKIYDELFRLNGYKPNNGGKITCNILENKGGFSSGYSFSLDGNRIFEWKHNHSHEMGHVFQRDFGYIPTWYSEGEAYMYYLLIGKKLGHFLNDNNEDYYKKNKPNNTYSNIEDWDKNSDVSANYNKANHIMYYVFNNLNKNGDKFFSEIRKLLKKTNVKNDDNALFIKVISTATGNFEETMKFFKCDLGFKSVSNMGVTCSTSKTKK